jgi:hypothetical protein
MSAETVSGRRVTDGWVCGLTVPGRSWQNSPWQKYAAAQNSSILHARMRLFSTKRRKASENQASCALIRLPICQVAWRPRIFVWS